MLINHLFVYVEFLQVFQYSSVLYFSKLYPRFVYSSVYFLSFSNYSAFLVFPVSFYQFE
eukprot:UN28268